MRRLGPAGVRWDGVAVDSVIGPTTRSDFEEQQCHATKRSRDGRDGSERTFGDTTRRFALRPMGARDAKAPAKPCGSTSVSAAESIRGACKAVPKMVSESKSFSFSCRTPRKSRGYQ